MSQEWTKVQIKVKKPAPRNYHTTLCIEDPHTGHHPLLMVVGGNDNGSILSDVWLLDVINGVWTEVYMCTFFCYYYMYMHISIFHMYMYVYTYTVECMACA